jgi:hypothetical protein
VSVVIEDEGIQSRRKTIIPYAVGTSPLNKQKFAIVLYLKPP